MIKLLFMYIDWDAEHYRAISNNVLRSNFPSHSSCHLKGHSLKLCPLHTIWCIWVPIKRCWSCVGFWWTDKICVHLVQRVLELNCYFSAEMVKTKRISHIPLISFCSASCFTCPEVWSRHIPPAFSILVKQYKQTRILTQSIWIILPRLGFHQCLNTHTVNMGKGSHEKMEKAENWWAVLAHCSVQNSELKIKLWGIPKCHLRRFS